MPAEREREKERDYSGGTIGPIHNETVARVLEGNYGVLIILGETLSVVCIPMDTLLRPTTQGASR